MALSPGTRLGPYAVTAKIGEGGMGEVYQATDTRLDRTVAIKVLPEHVASDADLRQRFEREAKTIASLNHPHICTLYDVGEQPSTGAGPAVTYLVMELLEGDTLAARLTTGPLPTAEVLRYAAEIADALDKAHRQGITHRDLKPGNIMLTKSGATLLDFGLAKLKQPGTIGAEGVTAAATQSEPLTGRGAILGTPQYMAPEQLEGKDADARTDIFAFGAVVYEMATGQRAFTGDSQASLIGAILKDEPPPMSTLQPVTPVALDYIVRTCLAKDPDDRWQSAGDVVRQVRGIIDGGSQPSVAVPDAAAPQAVGWRRAVVASLATLILGGAVIGLAVWSATQPTDPPPEAVRRFTLDIGPASPVPGSNLHAMLAWSPDGTRLVYTANLTGVPQLFVRDLDDLETRPLDGTEGAYKPFFSPEGEWVGFFRLREGVLAHELKRVAVGGGTPLTLGEGFGIGGATWLPDGSIIAPYREGREVKSRLHRIPETGGTPVPLTTLDAEREQPSQLWPHALPGGTHVLFTEFVRGSRRAGWTMNAASVAVMSLDTGEHHVVVEGGFNARYLPTGHLVFARDGALWGVPFDLDRLVTTGPEEVVLQGVEINEDAGALALSVSADGTLVYWPGDTADPRPTRPVLRGQPVWVDRDGQATPIGADRRDIRHPRLSPDNTRLALTVTSPDGTDIWVDDLERGTSTRLTNDGTSVTPAWSLDGNRVFFSSGDRAYVNVVASDTRGLYSRAADGSGERATLLTDAEVMVPYSWTPDGQFLSFIQSDGLVPRSWDIWTVSLAGDRVPYLVRPLANYGTHDLSPNGQWMAYDSTESGEVEVYIQRYPELGEKVTVSTGGGFDPVWSPDGSELFYRSVPRAGDPMMMMVVTVSTEPTLRVSRAEELFEDRYLRVEFPNGATNYDVSADGQRFLMISVGEAGDAEDSDAEAGDAEAAPPHTRLIVIETGSRS